MTTNTVPQGKTRITGVSILHRSEKSVLFAIEGVEHWCPKSQVEIEQENTTAPGSTYSITIPTWLAHKMGLEGEEGPEQSKSERRPSGDEIDPRDVVMPSAPLEAAHNGTYTATFSDGSQMTFRIRTQKADAKFAPGQRLMAILECYGAEPEYQSIGFVDSELGRSKLTVWGKWEGCDQARAATRVLFLADGMAQSGNYYASMGGKCWIREVTLSPRCIVCNLWILIVADHKRGIHEECER